MITRTCENCYGGYDPDDEGADGVCGQCAWDEDDEESTDRSGCNQEMCPMWDGHLCPCATFGLDKNDHGDDDAVSVYSDGRDYLLGYHGAIKRIPVKDFDYANLPEIRRELEAYVKEHRQPDGRTADGRPYWL